VTNDTHDTKHKGWIGVDLDGTLAVYHGWQGAFHIGPPIERMASRVRQWLKEGKEVRIMTARVTPGKADRQDCQAFIDTWCLMHFDQIIPTTHEKDTAMLELWDDRCVQVIPNTGRRADSLKDRLMHRITPFILPFLSRETQLAQTLRCQYDMHDYIDWEDGKPWHMTEEPCVRCGKKFSI
jgi:hypothetical protein